MPLVLTEEQTLLREIAREFVADKSPIAELRRVRDDVDPNGFSHELWKEMAELGWASIPFAESFGGADLGAVETGVLLQECGRTLAPTPLLATVMFGGAAVADGGNETLRKDVLPAVCTGDRLLAVALEEGTRHAPYRIATTATATADGFSIDGAKQFITNSGTPITRFVTVTAVTGERDGRKEISTLIVPSGTPGFTVGPAYDKVGWHASDTHPLAFDGVRVPEQNLLGERGRGFAAFLNILDEGRIAIAALATGAAEGCLEEAIAYARQRVVFGERLASRQSIQFTIARMQARVHTARLAWHHAARLCGAGRPFTAEAAIAKLTAGEAAMDNARDATQIFGGNGFMNEFPVARHYRDAKILEIGEGTTEVQLLVISRALGLAG